MNRLKLAAAAVAVLALAGCSGTTKPTPTATASGQHNAAYDTGQQILAWYDSTGTADSAKFATDAAAIGKDALNGDTQAMSTHCFSLDSHATDAGTHSAFPDPAGQDHWSKALSLYVKGAADCAAGAFTKDPAAIAAATQELKQGAQEIDALNARVNEITAAAK